MSEDDNIGSIEGAGKLLAFFGYWPSFHDAEVLWIRVDRKPAGDSGYGPTLEALIHAFEMTSEIDPKGYYVVVTEKPFQPNFGWEGIMPA